MSTYDEAKATRDVFEARLREIGKRWNAIGQPYTKDAMGLTPAHVKAMPEWRAAKAEYDAFFAKVRAFNAVFARTYKREIREERRLKYREVSHAE